MITQLPNLKTMKKSDIIQWLHTPEGLEYLKSLLNQGCKLKTIGEEYIHIEIPNIEELHAIAPVVAKEITKHRNTDPDYKASMQARKEASKLQAEQYALDKVRRRPAYRLVFGYNPTGKNRHHGTISTTTDDPDTLWDDPSIVNYFKFYRLDHEEYRQEYLKALKDYGIYKLSNLYYLLYCTITYKDTIAIQIPPKTP